MKRLIWIFITLSILILPSISLAGLVAPARITFSDGEVLFRTPDGEEWLTVAINTPLDEGDSIWCPDDSRAELQLADGTVIRLESDTQLDLLAIEKSFTHLHLASGKLYLRSAQGMAKESLQIDADDTTVLPAARTRLRIDMLPNSLEEVAIFKGSAYVEGNGSRTRVRAGEQIALEDGHQELLSLNPPDSWELWNKERDLVQSRSARADSYLPEELRSYSSELDSNGRWERVPEYGMVWRPTIILSDDWAPYRSGRWIWKGDDYIWISSENWGWLPYHYGRWAVIAGFGWCWVPPERGDVFWGPGYVGWHRDGNRIGWTPLAPGEIFYGRRNYGRHSINITTTQVVPGSIVYRNRDARGGLTVIQQNDFLRGRVTSQTGTRSPSLSVSVSIGSPRVQPIRETRMPIIKQTPPRVVPPRIERSDHQELRTRFPRIKPNGDRQGSSQQPVISPAPSAISQQPVNRERKETRPTASAPSELKPRPEDETRKPDRHPSHLQPPPAAVTSPSQRNEPPHVTAPAEHQAVPAAGGPRTDRSRGDRTAPAVTIPHEKPAARNELNSRERTPGEAKPRNVWKLSSPEQSGERDTREGGKDREPRRERRER